MSTRSARPSGTMSTKVLLRREREILDAAARIFERDGYQAAMVQDIADAVGLHKGSLYYYISTKEDLLFRLLMDHTEAAGSTMVAAAELEGPPLDRIREYVRRYVGFEMAHQREVAVFHRDLGALSAQRQRLIQERRAEFQHFLVALIEAAQGEGAVPAHLDPHLAASFVHGACNWVHQWYRADGPATPAAIGDGFAELAAGALVSGELGG